MVGPLAQGEVHRATIWISKDEGIGPLPETRYSSVTFFMSGSSALSSGFARAVGFERRFSKCQHLSVFRHAGSDEVSGGECVESFACEANPRSLCHGSMREKGKVKTHTKPRPLIRAF